MCFLNLSVSKCRLTSYSSRLLFQATLNFHFSFEKLTDVVSLTDHQRQ